MSRRLWISALAVALALASLSLGVVAWFSDSGSLSRSITAGEWAEDAGEDPSASETTCDGGDSTEEPEGDDVLAATPEDEASDDVADDGFEDEAAAVGAEEPSDDGCTDDETESLLPATGDGHGVPDEGDGDETTSPDAGSPPSEVDDVPDDVDLTDSEESAESG